MEKEITNCKGELVRRDSTPLSLSDWQEQLKQQQEHWKTKESQALSEEEQNKLIEKTRASWATLERLLESSHENQG
jgi:hypothetical protein